MKSLFDGPPTNDPAELPATPNPTPGVAGSCAGCGAQILSVYARCWRCTPEPVTTSPVDLF